MSRFLPILVLGVAISVVPGCGEPPATADPRPPATADDRRPIALGIAGDRFTIDGAPGFLIFVSYFDALPRAAAAGGVDADFAYLEGKVQGVRIFPNWWGEPCAPLRTGPDTLIDVDGNIQPDAWRTLQSVLDRAAAHHLVVDLSLTRETVTDNGSPARVLSFDAYARAVTTLIGSADYMKGKYPHVLIDVQNEWPRFADAKDVEALLTGLRAADPQRILAASSSGGPYQPIGLAVPNMVAAYHDPREKDWFTLDAATRVVNGVRATLGGAVQPIYLQEPAPASARCGRADHDTDPAHFRDAMNHAREAGAAAWTFHSRLGFSLRDRSLTQQLEDAANAPEKTFFDRLLK
nr:Unknown Function [uncultured bacterium]